MRLIVKLLVILLIALSTVVAVLYYKPHLVEGIVKSLAEYSLSNKIMRVQIGDVELSKNLIVFKDIVLEDKKMKIAGIEKVEMNYSLQRLIKERGLFCGMKISNFVMDEIKFDGTGDIEYDMSHKKVDNLKINFVGGGSMDLSASYETSFGSPHSLVSNGHIVDLPLMLHKAFWSIAPGNGIVTFLKDYIGNGYLSGNWNINLDNEFFAGSPLKPTSISGTFALRELALSYDVEYPVLQNLNADVEMSGTKLTFNISHGYSGKVALYDGRVDLDWEKGENSEVIIKTKGSGPVLDIVEFIPRDTVEDLKKHSIDLTKIDGQVKLDFAMTIPLLPGTENIYEVKADISNMNLKAFDDKLELSKSALKATFDGKRISIVGNGKVNGFDSDLNYSIALEDPEGVENILGIKLKFAPTSDLKNNNFSVVSGKSVLDISYKSKGNKGDLTANANLKDMEFFIEKLGLRKARGSKANLQITSSGEGLMPSGLSIKVTGDNNLQILGDVKFGDKAHVLNISKLQYFDTDVKAQLTMGASSLKAVISGANLDLSGANMMSFLEKDSKGRDTDIQVNVAKIRMKHNIWIDDFVMSMRCDKVKCYAGEMDSKIGTQSFRMRLSTQGNTEQWEVISTNAGALFKALGMYDNMKAGSMMLIINTSRKDAEVGKPLPVVDGHFVLKKFVTTDTPILTRMVSFISFSGMKSLISGNKNISFSEMVGDFTYDGDVINIKNGAAEGPFFDFTMSGWIDTKKHTVKLKGNVTPSLYGISKMVRKIPIIGGILGGSGHRKGLISPPYTVNSKY